MIQALLNAVQAILNLLTPAATYVVDIGVVAGGAGYAAELRAEGRTLRVKSVWFSEPSVAITYRLIKAATASTGGTSTSGTVVGMKNGGMVDSRVLLFTVAPTAGLAIGDVFRKAMATTQSVSVTFGDNGTEALEISGTQALGVNVSAAATIVGNIIYQVVG